MTKRAVWVERTEPESKTWVVPMPVGAKILSVQNQHEKLTVWFECDPRAGREERHLKLVHTGSEFSRPVNDAYLGTVQFGGGAYVLHVYEVVR